MRVSLTELLGHHSHIPHVPLSWVVVVVICLPDPGVESNT